MKTLGSLWKLTALILVLLILGMTPAAAQNSVPQSLGAGPVPMSVDQAATDKGMLSVPVAAETEEITPKRATV